MACQEVRERFVFRMDRIMEGILRKGKPMEKEFIFIAMEVFIVGSFENLCLKGMELLKILIRI